MRRTELPGRRKPAGMPLMLMMILAAAWLTAGTFAAAANQPAGPPAVGTQTVIIEGMRFHPEKIVVRRGERIKWINKDPFPHTVTATDGRFDSGAIRPDGSWTYVPRKAGEYDYRCAFHATMKGRVLVR